MTTQDNPLGDYEHLHRIMTERMSVRRLKPDPIPDDYVTKVVEAGRWAMSGANSQPWEFIVVKDERVKRALFEAYRDVNSDFGTQPIRSKATIRRSSGSARRAACHARGRRRVCLSASSVTGAASGARSRARLSSGGTRVTSPTRSPMPRR